MTYAPLVCIFEMAGCLGMGMIFLRLIGLHETTSRAETSVWAWAIGVGLLGAFLLPLSLLGMAKPAWLGLILACGLPGLFLLPRPSLRLEMERDFLLLALLLLLVVTALVMVGLAPPTDADSLAYHFARPKQILTDGQLHFLPQAVEGAIPLLVHLTYLPALALGGEKAMTLWATLSAICPLLGVGIVARRWLSRRQSALLVLLLLTTPGMMYSIGSGQVEARVIPFVFMAALAVWEGKRRDDLKWLFLAGLLGGCFAAAKYFGLFFLVAAGLMCLARPRRFAGAVVFSFGAAVTGCGIYLWQWAVSGDPVFPVLFTALHLPDSGYWNADQADYFQRYYAGSEKPAPVNLFWFLLYPFKATLDGLAGWESVRTGLGPAPLLLLPFALASAFCHAKDLKRHPLTWMMAVACLFYVLWFFLGASQRIRHLLPVFPLILLVLMTAALRLVHGRSLVMAALSLLLAAQIAGLLVYARPALAFHLTDQDRSEYISRYVANYSPVAWINENQEKIGRLLYFERQLTYYINVPKYYASSPYQSLFTIIPDHNDDYVSRWRQGRQLGITHILFIQDNQEKMADRVENRTVQAFLDGDCAKLEAMMPVRYIQSRVLPGLASSQGLAGIVQLTPESCDLERLRLAIPDANGYKLSPDSAK